MGFFPSQNDEKRKKKVINRESESYIYKGNKIETIESITIIE
jgi:hypothetical protein